MHKRQESVFRTTQYFQGQRVPLNVPQHDRRLQLFFLSLRAVKRTGVSLFSMESLIMKEEDDKKDIQDCMRHLTPMAAEKGLETQVPAVSTWL